MLFLSLKRACFELNWCRFGDKIVPVSSLRIFSFEPKSCQFRSRTVHLSSPVHAVIEPIRTVSIRALVVTICYAANLGDILPQVSFSKHNEFIRTSLIHGNWHMWEHLSKRIKGEKHAKALRKEKNQNSWTQKGTLQAEKICRSFWFKQCTKLRVSKWKKAKLSKLPGLSSFADFGLETGSARRRGLEIKVRKKALDSSVYDNTSPIIGLKERNWLPYFMVYSKTVFYLPIVSWYLSQSCKFLFPLSKTWSPPPTILLCFVRAKGSTVAFATCRELYLKKLQSTEIDVISILFGLYDWTKGKRCPSTVGRSKYI